MVASDGLEFWPVSFGVSTPRGPRLRREACSLKHQNIKNTETSILGDCGEHSVHFRVYILRPKYRCRNKFGMTTMIAVQGGASLAKRLYSKGLRLLCGLLPALTFHQLP